MSKRIKWSGVAQGHKVDEDQQSVDFALEHLAMTAAKVSQEDARYLIREGHWSDAMNALMEEVARKNDQREMLDEDNDD